MRRRILTPLILILISSSVSFSQVLQVKGYILEEGSSKPIPHANLALINTTIGTSTDSTGHFELRLPNSFREFELTISSLGYKSSSFKISDLLRNNENKIFLKEHAIVMPEIVIRTNEISDQAMIIKALYETRLTEQDYDLTQLYHGTAVDHNDSKVYDSDALLKESYYTRYNGASVVILQKRNNLGDDLDAQIEPVYFFLDKWNFPANRDFPCDLRKDECSQTYLFERSFTFYNDKLCYSIAYRSLGNPDDLSKEYTFGKVVIDPSNYGIVSLEVNKRYSESEFAKTGPYKAKQGKYGNTYPIEFKFIKTYHDYEDRYYVSQLELHRTDKIVYPNGSLSEIKAHHITNTVKVDFLGTGQKPPPFSPDVNNHFDLNLTRYDSAFWMNFTYDFK